ncbi:MAG: BLUF domain-containing protein [Litoreibacter sp.]|nr:BLUF domain-containing protein [Litoreibacter sp.]MCY4335557.1 BLUF domain-containing protein [Litoreibacter sp.]
MYCVVYSSDARPGTTHEDVARILEQAEAANTRARITGALMFDGQRFCQLLKGDEAQVTRTMKRIKRDLRHSNLRILDASQTLARRFPGWSMLEVGQEEFQDVLEALTA